MKILEALAIGKRCRWPSRSSRKADAKAGRRNEDPVPFAAYPAEGILRRETGPREIPGQLPDPGAAALRRLLDSFPVRKNAELAEGVRRSEWPEPEARGQGPMGEVFVLTKKILSKILGPLNWRLLRDPEVLETALGKVHPRLPISFRLILRRKEYIRFMLDHRERLVP
jgi:hypothetical protein